MDEVLDAEAKKGLPAQQRGLEESREATALGAEAAEDRTGGSGKSRHASKRASKEGGAPEASTPHTVKKARTAPEPAAAAPAPALLSVIPDDPDDERLTLAGAVCDSRSRLVLSGYNDLKSHFAGEPPPDEHPHPDYPGLRIEELPGGEDEVSLQGLKSWSDPRGAGWVASKRDGSGRAENRWFSASTWGSWRLAFLLAKLQREVWRKPAESTAQEAAEAPRTKLQGPPGPAQDDGIGGSSSSSSKPLSQFVQSGAEEWLPFTPSNVDESCCLARTWEDGAGGQCHHLREDGFLLCQHHERQALSTKGLVYGFVNGPIPAAKLVEFQRAVLSSRTYTEASAASETAEAGRRSEKKALRTERPTKGKEQSRKSKKTKHLKKVKKGHSKDARRLTKRSRSSRVASFAAQELDQPELPLAKRPRVASSSSTSAQIGDSGAATRPAAKVPAKWTSAPPRRSAGPPPKPSELQPTIPRAFAELLQEDGRVKERHWAQVYSVMQDIGENQLADRLGILRITLATVKENPQRAWDFTVTGGLSALKPWIDDAVVPSNDKATAGSDRIVLIALWIVEKLIPSLTVPLMQQSGIGLTLARVRLYHVSMAPRASRLINDISAALRLKKRKKEEQEAARRAAQAREAAAKAEAAEAAARVENAARQAAAAAALKYRTTNQPARPGGPDQQAAGDVARPQPEPMLPAPDQQGGALAPEAVMAPAKVAIALPPPPPPAPGAANPQYTQVTLPRGRYWPRFKPPPRTKDQEIEIMIKELFNLGEILEQAAPAQALVPEPRSPEEDPEEEPEPLAGQGRCIDLT